MTKLTNRILLALLAWLGFDSALENGGKTLGIVDMRTGDVTVIHHRAIVGRTLHRLRSKLPFRKGDQEDPAPMEHQPQHGGGPTPMDIIGQMGVPGADEVEQFERYREFIGEHFTHTDTDPVVVEHANASNRTLLNLVGVDLTNPDVMRALMFACCSISVESFKAAQHGFMPPAHVISDGLAMSFAHTLQSIERGAMPDDLIDPETEAG